MHFFERIINIGIHFFEGYFFKYTIIIEKRNSSSLLVLYLHFLCLKEEGV